MRYVLALAASLALCAAAFADGTLSGAARVVDGDTLVIAGVHIRLAGIDAPEMPQTCTEAGGAVYECGRDARATLVDIIRGLPVTCVPSALDRYGRAIAACRTDAVPDLGAQMVARGWAVDYRQYDKSCAYCSAEAAARQSGIGLWSGQFDMPAQWRQRHRR